MSHVSFCRQIIYERETETQGNTESYHSARHALNDNDTRSIQLRPYGDD